MDAMVTGRMPEEKKAAGNAVIEACGSNPSKMISALYDRIIKDQSVDFLFEEENEAPTREDWKSAALFVDSLAVPLKTRFDAMTDREIRVERLKSRGLL